MMAKYFFDYIFSFFSFFYSIIYYENCQSNMFVCGILKHTHSLIQFVSCFLLNFILINLVKNNNNNLLLISLDNNCINKYIFIVLVFLCLLINFYIYQNFTSDIIFESKQKVYFAIIIIIKADALQRRFVF